MDLHLDEQCRVVEIGEGMHLSRRHLHGKPWMMNSFDMIERVLMCFSVGVHPVFVNS